MNELAGQVVLSSRGVSYLARDFVRMMDAPAAAHVPVVASPTSNLGDALEGLLAEIAAAVRTENPDLYERALRIRAKRPGWTTRERECAWDRCSIRFVPSRAGQRYCCARHRRCAGWDRDPRPHR